MTIVATLMAATVKAQDYDAMVDQITDQLPESDASEAIQALQQVERAKAMLEQVQSKQAQADKLREEAKKASKSDAKKKNKQAQTIEEPLYAQKVNAYNVYEKANSTLYGIFANNLKELASIGSSEVQGDVNDLTSFAADSWGKADKALKTIPKGKKPDQKIVANIKQDVNKNQIRAIQYQVEAYKFLIGPVGGSNTQPATTPTNNGGNLAESDDIVDNAFFSNLSQESDDSETAPAQQQTRSVNTDTMDDEGFNFVQSCNTADRVIYKVQIAADAIPLSIEKLRQICPTDDIINNEVQNGIYRYTIGYFTNYDDAKSQAISLRGRGVDGAFVVAYKNGVRIKEIRDVYNN